MCQPQAKLIYEDTLEQWGTLYQRKLEPGRYEEHSFEVGCFSVIKSVLCPVANQIRCDPRFSSLINSLGICNLPMYRWLFTRDSQYYKRTGESAAKPEKGWDCKYPSSPQRKIHSCDDSDEYKEKVAVLLKNTKTYLKLTDKRLNPTTSVAKDLNKMLLSIKNENNGTAPQFDPNLYRKLHCSTSTPASLLGSSKNPQTWKAIATHHK